MAATAAGGESSQAPPAGQASPLQQPRQLSGQGSQLGLHLPRAATKTNDKEIPAANGHGAEEEGVSPGLALRLSALTKTQVLSTGAVTQG